MYLWYETWLFSNDWCIIFLTLAWNSWIWSSITFHFALIVRSTDAIDLFTHAGSVQPWLGCVFGSAGSVVMLSSLVTVDLTDWDASAFTRQHRSKLAASVAGASQQQTALCVTSANSPCMLVATLIESCHRSLSDAATAAAAAGIGSKSNLYNPAMDLPGSEPPRERSLFNWQRLFIAAEDIYMSVSDQRIPSFPFCALSTVIGLWLLF